MLLVITRRYDDLHCNTQVGALLHQDLNIKSGKLQLQVLEYFFYVTRTIITWHRKYLIPEHNINCFFSQPRSSKP